MCGFTCTKYLVFFFNFLFWILGLVLMGIGVWAAVDKNFLDNVGLTVEKSDNLNDIIDVIQMFAYSLIILGAIIMVIGFFGCCGAIRESQCCLGIFFVLLFLCFIVTVAIGGILLYFAVGSNEDFKEFPEHSLKRLTEGMWNALDKDAQFKIEKEFNCCGSSEDIDFGDGLTCAGKPIMELKKLGWQNGCFDQLQLQLVTKIKSNVYVAGVVMLAIALVELLGLTMVCVLCCGIKRAYAAV